MNINPALDGRVDDDGEFEPMEPDAGFNLNVRAIWATIYRNRIMLFMAVGLGILFAIVYLILATPKYEAIASVQIEQETTRILKGDATGGGRDTVDAERFLNTQLDIIKSRSVAMAVARNLHLIGNQDFLRRMHLPVSTGDTSSTVPISRQGQEQQVTGVLQGNMSVELPPDSRIASITFRSPDPKLAAQVANSFADSYIQSDIARKYDTSAYARQFISQQLQDAKQQLERAERAALAYGRQQRLIDTSNGSDATQGGASSTPKSLTVARLVSLNTAYADAVARRTQAEQKWRQAQGAAIMSLPEVLANPAIQQLQQQRAKAVAEYQDQRQIRKDDFPAIRQQKAQIDELTRQIDRLSDNVRGSLRSEFEAAQRQEDSLKQQMGGLEQATLNEQQREVQLSILRRATDTSRSLYDTLLQRFRELSAEAGVQPNNIQIVDRADVPSVPKSPRTLIALLLGIVGGVAAGITAIFVVENLNDTVRSGEDVSRKLDLPLLGSVPKVRGSDVGPDLQDLKSTVSEAYSSIRASLLMASRAGLPRTLAFTSVQPGEGKTTSSFATAIGLARIGRRVAVIDCDLRRPALHKAFNIANRSGMSGYLSGQAKLDDILQATSFEGVRVVTSGAIPPNPTELLSGELLHQMLRELHQSFDVVVIDAPPILGLADAVIVGSQADGTVIVLEAGRNYHGGLRTAVGRMRKAGTRLVGAIITKQNMRDLGYNYVDKYQYTYGERS